MSDPSSQDLRPVDHEERVRALDTTRSFIVQAPAGSGKTELMARRIAWWIGVEKVPKDRIVAFTERAAEENGKDAPSFRRRAVGPDRVPACDGGDR